MKRLPFLNKYASASIPCFALFEKEWTDSESSLYNTFTFSFGNQFPGKKRGAEKKDRGFRQTEEYS